MEFARFWWLGLREGKKHICKEQKAEKQRGSTVQEQRSEEAKKQGNKNPKTCPKWRKKNILFELPKICTIRLVPHRLVFSVVVISMVICWWSRSFFSHSSWRLGNKDMYCCRSKPCYCTLVSPLFHQAARYRSPLIPGSRMVPEVLMFIGRKKSGHFWWTMFRFISPCYWLDTPLVWSKKNELLNIPIYPELFFVWNWFLTKIIKNHFFHG